MNKFKTGTSCTECEHMDGCPAYDPRMAYGFCQGYEEEIEPPMFPKGPHQLLGWAYSMEGIDPHEPSVHAKLIQMRDDGDIRPFPVGVINLKGLSQTEIHGLAAGIRERVEKSVSDEQRDVIWAKYCDSVCVGSMKCDGMTGLANHAYRRMRRSKELIADCIWHIVCTDKERETCSMYDIGKRHGVGSGTVHRTTVQLRKIMRKLLDEADVVIRNVFSDDGVF